MKRAATPSPARTAAPKLDMLKLHRAEYVAPRKPVLISTTPAWYLTVLGQGSPASACFEARIGALYATAFTIKMTRKFAGQQDYAVARLECRYLNFERSMPPDPELWQWQLLIRTPEFVAQADLDAAVAALRKRGKEGDAALVRLERIDEGRAIQMLHIGPYEREGDTLAVMNAFAAAHGVERAGVHHEIYISDPRRVPAEKLKTILRMPVRPSA